MPKRKQIVKTRAERSAEEYFPVGSSSRTTVEKVYNRRDFSDLVREETGTKKGKAVRTSGSSSRSSKTTVRKSKRKTTARRSTKTSSRKTTSKTRKAVPKKIFEPQKITLKKGGYELIITEKPQAAAKIATSLGKSTRKNLGGAYYYEVDRDGNKIVVACAAGHLFTLTQKVSGSGTPVFDLYWAPNHMVLKKDFTKKFYDAILKLSKGAGEITVATDYDIEGEVIGLNIVRYLCGQPDAKRMKYSTLTSAELNNSFDNRSNSLDWGQAIAGQTRHYLDWIYGINLSRALMDAIKTTGKFRIMSIGRVQGPTLKMIVDKEREINKFKSKKYWQFFITITNGKDLELKYTKDIWDKKELEQFKDLKGKDVEVATTNKTQSAPPNVPFNLTGLQMESYKVLGLTPTRTLQIAQSLYLNGIISYPRTSSQKLPDAIGYKQILKKLAPLYKAEKHITRDKPIEGKGTDSAHPSIFPTGENENFKLSGDDAKLYDLIARRFLALFCDNAVIDRRTISARYNKWNFTTSGSSIKKKGWMEVYHYAKVDEKEVPETNGTFKVNKIRDEEKETQPPKRYSPASILSELEKRNLGTKATRASILETLYDRNYIENRSVQATPLGLSLISTLEKYSPVIIDEKLTRDFEKGMDSISEAKNGFEEKGDKILKDAEKSIVEILGNFDQHKTKIGEELLEANIEFREQQKVENALNQCPKCKEGNLAIMYSKKTRRYFVACNRYPDCKNTYSVPPNGKIMKTEKVCEDCGWPMLMRLASGKRPWIFCFNPDCEKNKERIEEYRKKMEGQVVEAGS